MGGESTGMKVAVTGATGLVGRALVAELLARGAEVRVLSRQPAAARMVLGEDCDYFAWAPQAHELDEDALSGATAVVHLAGEPVIGGRWTPRRKKAIFESRAGGAQLISSTMAAMSVESRPRVFVSASAVGYYGDHGNYRVDETTPPGHDFLAEVCQAWEQGVMDAESLGIRTATVRIGLVLSADGGAFTRLHRIFKLRLGGELGSGRQWLSWIHIDDLVAMFCFVLEHEGIRGAINGVAPRPVTNTEFTVRLSEALGAAAFLDVPAFALRWVYGEQAGLFLTSARVVPNRASKLLFGFRYPELSLAFHDLLGHG